MDFNLKTTLSQKIKFIGIILHKEKVTTLTLY